MCERYLDPVVMEKALLTIAHGLRPSLQSIGREVRILRPELRRIAADALATAQAGVPEDWNGPSPKSMEKALRAISSGIRPDAFLLVSKKLLNCNQLRAIARVTLEIKDSKRVVPGLYWKPAVQIKEEYLPADTSSAHETVSV